MWGPTISSPRGDEREDKGRVCQHEPASVVSSLVGLVSGGGRISVNLYGGFESLWDAFLLRRKVVFSDIKLYPLTFHTDEEPELKEIRPFQVFEYHEVKNPHKYIYYPNILP